MAQFTIKIKGMDELIKQMENAGPQYADLLRQAMVKATTMVKKDIQEEITGENISTTGNLRRSVSVVEATKSRGVVGVGEKYGLYVEKGTRPHFPPVAPLERWAQVKLGQPGLGVVIARKIAREGTKAHAFVEPVFKRDIRKVLNIFSDAGRYFVQALAR